MSDFTNLLISLCDIQVKSSTLSGYEKVLSWTTSLSGVHTRHDHAQRVEVSDSKVRINVDNDVFFFNPDVAIVRGNRIVFGGENFDVVKVNKLYDSTGVHHLEAIARLVDHE